MIISSGVFNKFLPSLVPVTF